MAPPVGIKEKTRTVKRHLRALEKKHRLTSPPDSMPVLDRLILALLVFHAPQTNANRALRQLKDQFIDWNDLRVSSIREIALVLEKNRVDPELAYTIKSILGEVYQLGHTLSLDFLLEEPPDRVRKYLGKFKAIPSWLIAYLMAEMSKESTVPLDPHTSRICQRLGLFGRKSSLQTRRRTLASIVSAGDVLRFHRLFVEHGKKTCREENPRCDVCTLARDCEYRRRQKKTRRAK